MLSLDGARRGMTIAVDAMGGDHAPDEIIKGALEAAEQGVNVLLVGPEERILGHLNGARTEMPVVHAPDVIDMDAPVTKSLLRRSEASLHATINLVSKGTADGAVSCGNSAAIMALATYLLHRQPGIDRPAFGGGIPTHDGSVFVLDIGATPTVSADNLVQFAVMGDVFLRTSKGIEAPRIALLSNGTEASKGTEAIKEANEALARTDLNFIGNVEGNQIFAGVADIVVCDGFSGNVLLKTAEGVAIEIFDLLKKEISKDLIARIASSALMPTFRRIKRQIDFQEYGGAPVLGVNGVMINCHGRSKAKAVTNAILIAERMARERVVDRIGDELHPDGTDGGKRRRFVRALHLRPSTP